MGVDYAWLQSQEPTSWRRAFMLTFVSQRNCMLVKDCREFARSDDVVVDDFATGKILRLAAKKERERRAQEAAAPASAEKPSDDLLTRMHAFGSSVFGKEGDGAPGLQHPGPGPGDFGT